MDTAPAFATAVNAVIARLEEDGYEIADASIDPHAPAHVVAERDDDLLFVLVQGLEGAPLSEFSEETYYAQILPVVESVAWHPKGRTIVDLAAPHGGRAVLALVGLIETDDLDADDNRVYLAKVFPFRAIDASGVIAS